MLKLTNPEGIRAAKQEAASTRKSPGREDDSRVQIVGIFDEDDLNTQSSSRDTKVREMFLGLSV